MTTHTQGIRHKKILPAGAKQQKGQKKSRKTVVIVPMPYQQKCLCISISCGSWDDYTCPAAPQLSYESYSVV